MKQYIIFDNGGRTADRYTIINTETGDIFSAGEDMNDPGRITRYCGNCAHQHIVLYGAGWRQRLPAKKIIRSEVTNYVNNAKLDSDWIGVEIALNSLPARIKEHLMGNAHSKVPAPLF